MWTTENMPGQSGKTAIVTGANTGIGFETALALYKAGAHVIIACRDHSRAEEALNRIAVSGGKGSLEIGLLDLASLRSVRSFSKKFTEKHGKLDLLINNAGVMMPPSAKTEEGYELQFGVNFIGHFALTGLLYPILKQTPGARIVTVSSLAYLRGSIHFDNLKSEQSYDPVREYMRRANWRTYYWPWNCKGAFPKRETKWFQLQPSLAPTTPALPVTCLRKHTELRLKGSVR